MKKSTITIALATPRVATSLEDGLERVRYFMSEAANQEAEIVCFPEAYLPGLRGRDFDVFAFEEAQHNQVLHAVAEAARNLRITTILGMERPTKMGRQIVAYVFDERGNRQGAQTKNQLDPSEDQFYVPGNVRRLFFAGDVKFGIAICHEGWRYPETVRWAATRGAKIVFHPQHTGHEQKGVKLKKWGAADSPYYEKAMAMRARENTIYFASVNYALRFQESATSVIDPSGECQAFQPYGEEGVLIATLDLEKATGLLASRYAPDRYRAET
jgi:predicted amidohydrolase